MHVIFVRYVRSSLQFWLGRERRPLVVVEEAHQIPTSSQLNVA